MFWFSLSKTERDKVFELTLPIFLQLVLHRGQSKLGLDATSPQKAPATEGFIYSEHARNAEKHSNPQTAHADDYRHYQKQNAGYASNDPPGSPNVWRKKFHDYSILAGGTGIVAAFCNWGTSWTAVSPTASTGSPTWAISIFSAPSFAVFGQI